MNYVRICRSHPSAENRTHWLLEHLPLLKNGLGSLWHNVYLMPPASCMPRDPRKVPRSPMEAINCIHGNHYTRAGHDCKLKIPPRNPLISFSFLASAYPPGVYRPPSHASWLARGDDLSPDYR